MVAVTKDNMGYDTFDSCVVAAETKEDAKKIHPRGAIYPYWSYNEWAVSSDSVQVKLIGEATPETKRGVILASFNAG